MTQAGLFGKKLPPAPSPEPEFPVTTGVLAPPAPGSCLMHNAYTTQNPTPFCSRCGKPASEAQRLRWMARR